MGKSRIRFAVALEERAQIRKAFLAGSEAGNPEEVAYIVKNLPKALNRLRNVNEDWDVKGDGMAEYFSTPLESNSGIPRMDWFKLPGLPEKTRNHLPKRDYDDDTQIFNTCLNRMRQRQIDRELPNGNFAIRKGLEGNSL